MKLFLPLRATRAAPRRQMRRSLFMLSCAGAVRSNFDLLSPSKLTCFKGGAQVGLTIAQVGPSIERVVVRLIFQKA